MPAGVSAFILTCNIIGLSVNDFLENFASLGLAREISLVSVRNIFLGDFLAWTFHKFELHAVLDFLDAHSLCFFLRDSVRNLGCENNIFTCFGNIHCLQYGGNDFLIVEVDESSVAFYYVLYHNNIGVRLSVIRSFHPCTAFRGRFLQR